LILLYSSIWGQDAVHRDSANWSCWAQSCTLYRGWKQINQPQLGWVNSGNNNDATGTAGDGAVVSLGDSGYAILQFPEIIYNGPGPDFAVFENAFNAQFLELAFVEVSSDGVHFVRFPAISKMDSNIQTGTFGLSVADSFYNLAGKYPYLTGTGFDLEELKDSSFIDINAIRFVKIVDVIGIVQSDLCSRDSRYYPINDPFPTPFNEGGFDLDAVGVIHSRQSSAIELNQNSEASFYPHPVKSGQERIYFYKDCEGLFQIKSIHGALLYTISCQAANFIDLPQLEPGIYIIEWNGISKQLIIYK
jgi:hypothetical protein